MIPHWLADKRIRAPMRATGPGGIVGDAFLDLAPGDPGYAENAAWLRARGHDPKNADAWAATGEIDTGETVTLTWINGIVDWPDDALDWALHAAAEGEVQLDDGAWLRRWLERQGFTIT